MASTRIRFAFFHGTMLLVTMSVFAAALLFARRELAISQLADEATRTVDQLAQAIAAAEKEKVQLMDLDTIAGSLHVTARIELLVRLDTLAGYFIVAGIGNKRLYRSNQLRLLSPLAEYTLGGVDSVLSVGGPPIVVSVPEPQPPPPPPPVTDETKGTADTTKKVVAPLPPPRPKPPTRYVVVSRASPQLPPEISHVIVALPIAWSELPITMLLGNLFVIAPLIFLLAIGAAYLMAPAALRPVGDMINEVEAITDGRSLHRRLPADQSSDEISRLSVTLNAMLTRLEHSFGGLRRFTADASHELKTPLTVMRADVERAMHPRVDPTERMVALEEALQEIARMSDLVDSLLTLARADEGRFDLVREPVPLRPLLQDVCETAVILGESAGLTIKMEGIEDAVVSGDQTRLRQMLLNLLTNAIKYTPRGGRVELTMQQRSSSEVVISVRDTGIGIAAGDLPHIFDRFWRADRARSRGSERTGFGLGLAIAQWIAQAHGGSLTVQSRLGRGSLFSVTLPTAIEGSTPHGEESLVPSSEGESEEQSRETDFTKS